MTAFDTEAGFRSTFAALLQQAAEEGARHIIWVDHDFERWPLNDEGLLEALTGFARQPGRQLQLLACRYDILSRDCPRFVTWRRIWGHAVDARVPEDGVVLPSQVLVDRRKALRIDDRAAWRGVLIDQAPEVHRLRQSCDALLQRADPGFAQTTLGL
jgi:hypothetical protein